MRAIAIGNIATTVKCPPRQTSERLQCKLAFGRDCIACAMSDIFSKVIRMCAFYTCFMRTFKNVH